MKLIDYIKNLLDTYKKGLAYDSLFKEFNNLLKIINTEREQFTQAIKDLETENLLLYAELDECSETQNKDDTTTLKISELITLMKKKTHYKPFKYAFKADGHEYDIKFSLLVEDNYLIKLYGDKIYNVYNPKTPEECVESVIKYFVYKQKPTYVTDYKQFHKKDYWQPVDEFLKTWRGDCDEISRAQHLLIKYLLDKTNNSEHYDRLYLHINDNMLGGHANNLWLHTDGYFYTIESSIEPERMFKKEWLKTPLANDFFYSGTRGIANLNYSTNGNGNVEKNFLK